VIGIDEPAGSYDEISYTDPTPQNNSELLEWSPALADNGVARGAVYPANYYREILVNADVVLAPVLSSLSPASGSTSGGNAVKIGGLYLDGATAVTFGSTPASSFSVDSSSQITAIAPASTASAVDVRVTGPGGSSEVGPADRYAFGGASTTTAPGGSALQSPKPTITGFSESSSRWRRGRSLPHISSAGGAPVGTTFSFSMNEPAPVTATFTQRVAGRRVGGRCLAPGRGNAGRPRCKRTLLVGSFTVPGHAGVDQLRFQGRLSSSKTLKPGAYLISLTARQGHGPKVFSRSLSFTIVS
jgi:IPT/TIG domain